MKPIEDPEGNKLYGFSLNDMRILIKWQKLQVILIGILLGILIGLLFWIGKHDVVTKVIYGG